MRCAVVCVTLFALAVQAHAQVTVPGGWSDVDTTDAGVQAALKAATAQLEGKVGFPIANVTVASASTQVVAGTNYKLVLTVNGKKGEQATWQAVVFKGLGNAAPKVSSLAEVPPVVGPAVEPISLGGGRGMPGGYSTVATNDAGVQAAFAVASAQLKNQTQATSVELTDAQVQVVAGKNYKLNMKAVGGTNGDGMNWLAVVYAPLGGGEDTVTSLQALAVMSPGAEGEAASLGEAASVGGYTAVDANDAGVLKAFELMKAQIALESAFPVTDVVLDEASSQVVAGTNYRLIASASGADGMSQEWLGVIYAPLQGDDTVTVLTPLVKGAPGPQASAASMPGADAGAAAAPAPASAATAVKGGVALAAAALAALLC